jgi:hypothetical protein
MTDNVAMLTIYLGPPATVPIRESVQTVLAARQETGDPIIMIGLLGYDDDPRELWEIPEARAYIRQVITAVHAIDADWWAQADLHEDTLILIALCLGVARVVPGVGVQFMRPGQTKWDD